MFLLYIKRLIFKPRSIIVTYYYKVMIALKKNSVFLCLSILNKFILVISRMPQIFISLYLIKVLFNIRLLEQIVKKNN